MKPMDMPDARLLQKEIGALLDEHLQIVPTSPQADLLESGAMDSLALVELLLQLELRYGLRISLESLDFEEFRSVASIAAFVTRSRAGE
jgi:acyl carrier protein